MSLHAALALRPGAVCNDRMMLSATGALDRRGVRCRQLSPAAVRTRATPTGPLWRGARYTHEDRARALRRGLRFIYRLARVPKNFEEYGEDFLWCFYSLSATTARSLAALRSLAHGAGAGALLAAANIAGCRVPPMPMILRPGPSAITPPIA